MKMLIALMILSLPLVSNASIVSFQCKSVELPGVHKFDAKGVVTIDEENKVDGIISLQLQKAQAEESVQVFEEIKISGNRLHFDAGKLLPTAFDQLNLVTNQAYIKSMSFLLDVNVNNASVVFSIDNFIYRSNCSTVDTTKADTTK